MQKILPITLFLLLIGMACSDLQELSDFENLENSPQLAFPLINSTFTLQDALENIDENADILVDSDGLLRFYYQSDTTIRTSQEVFDVLNRTLPPLVPVIDTLIGFPVINDEGIGVSSVIFKEGRLEYSFFNSNSSDIEVTVTVLQMFRDGQPLQQTHEVFSFQDLPVATFDLTDVELRPQNDSLFFKYEAYNRSNERVTVDNFLMLQKDVDYSYAAGVFTRSLLENLPDTLEFDFTEQIDGDLYFEEPKVTVTVDNSFGFPAELSFGRFDIITKDGSLLPLESDLIDNGISFNFPSFEEIGEVKETQFVFDHTNSNLPKVIEASPIGLIYELDATTNPNEDTPGFLTDESIFAYSVEAEFPLLGTITDLKVRDTLDIDINFESLESLEEMEIKMVTDNGLPLSASVQAYFMSGTQILDSLFIDGARDIIQAASIDSDGNVTKMNSQTTFIPIDNPRLENIKSANKLLLEATFNTSQDQEVSVRIENQQTLGIRMGVKANL